MKQKLFLLSLLLSAWSVSAAQEMRSDSLGLLDDVMQRIEAKSRYIPTVGGIVQGGWYYRGYHDRLIDANVNTFYLNTARVSIKGSPVDWFDYHLQVEFANTVHILDFQLNFHPLASTAVKSQYINFWVGQGKTPISLDNLYDPAHCEAVHSTMVTEMLLGYNSYLTPSLTNLSGGRDMGVALYGYALRVDWGGLGHDFFDYKVGVYNGSGINTLNVDKYMDVSGSLYLHPVKALTIGGSVYAGWYDNDERVKQDRTRAAASFRYADEAHWNVRAEYIWGNTAELKTDGWYASIEYTINPNWEKTNRVAIVSRYDALRLNMDRSATTHNVLVGINYRPMKWLYVQAHYNWRLNSSNATGFATQYHMPEVMACVIF